MNKYKKEYDELIKYRINNAPPNTEYIEIHHIIPRSLGGTNYKDNLVALLAREHLHAHWLLFKHYEYENPTGEECLKMLCAVDMMLTGFHSNTIKHIDVITEEEYQRFQYIKQKNSRKQVCIRRVLKNGSPTKGCKRITNLITGQHKCVKKDNLNDYLSTGNWILGNHNPEKMLKYLKPLFESVKQIGYLNTIKKFKVNRGRKWLRTMFKRYIIEYDREFFTTRGSPDFKPLDDKIRQLQELLQFYNKYGFIYIKENNLYSQSKERLLQLFRKYLPEYKYIQKDKNYTYEYAKKYFAEWQISGYHGVVKKFDYKYSNAALLKMFYKFKLLNKK